ncbi:hypothetical protein IV203_028206 [Nitzschia inconspicua]|uniref:Uncharacterized protein n=1 Tax=Nitzschia inconspicua TaxID=303405 RepID=A0A9K3PAF7_9STRA|nr:hypothetical protein IV203_028206 [Nitzschia inconspicua]
MRQLFPNPHLPILHTPLYLRHFVDRTTVPLSLNDVEEENEDEGIDVDDDSVEDAFEASELTEAELQRDRDLVGNEDVRADRYCRLNVAQVQDQQQIIQVLAHRRMMRWLWLSCLHQIGTTRSTLLSDKQHQLQYSQCNEREQEVDRKEGSRKSDKQNKTSLGNRNEFSKTTLLEDVRADRCCRLKVAQVQDLQQIIQVLALIEESCVGYGMYLECTRETPCHEFFQLDDTTRLKLSKGPLKFHEFKDKLSIQMLTYAPANVFYPGDRNFREVTEMSIEKRNARKRRATTESMPTATTSMSNDDQFAMMMMMMKKKEEEEEEEEEEGGRFCGDLTKYKQHLASKEMTNTRNNCFVCGEKTRTRCGMCSVGLHGHVNQGTVKGRSCYIDYHDECMFGLCRSDAAYFGRKKNQ